MTTYRDVDALRRALAENPRNLPCPTCGRPDCLTPADQSLGYRCHACIDREEHAREVAAASKQ